jgi:hypothetical protein
MAPKSGDEEMKDESDELRGPGIPNEKFLPQLHVFTFRKNHTFETSPLLRKSDLTP